MIILLALEMPDKLKPSEPVLILTLLLLAAISLDMLILPDSVLISMSELVRDIWLALRIRLPVCVLISEPLIFKVLNPDMDSSLAFTFDISALEFS